MRRIYVINKETIKQYLDPQCKGYISPCDIIRILSDCVLWGIFCLLIYAVLISLGMSVYAHILGFDTYVLQWYDFILAPVAGLSVMLVCMIIGVGLFLIMVCIVECLNTIKRKTKLCKIKLIRLK